MPEGQEPEPADVGVCCCLGRLQLFNFARPGRYEACAVTQASLYAAAAFWIISLYSVINGENSISIIEVGLEALLDFASTAVVLYRLAARDALRYTPRNEALEKRVSVALGMTMIVLGTVLISAAVRSLSSHGHHMSPSELSLDALLALPSALIYLVIGMMQLQMAWILDLRSLKQDAIISILGAVISVGALVAALSNMIIWLNMDYVTNENGTSVPVAVGDVHNVWLPHNAWGDWARMQYNRARVSERYHLWWLEDFLTIVSAAGLLLYGLFFLVEDTRDGCCWWTSAFWAAPLPPRTDDETGTGGDKGVAPKVADEATPLKDAKQKLPA